MRYFFLVLNPPKDFIKDFFYFLKVGGQNMPFLKIFPSGNVEKNFPKMVLKGQSHIKKLLPFEQKNCLGFNIPPP